MECSLEPNTNWVSDFTFIQASDPQYGLQANFDNTSLDVWESERASVRQAVSEWNKLQPRPKFVVICGDIADAFVNENASRRRQQLDDLKQDLSALDQNIPMIFLGGNHDFLNNPNSEAIAKYRSEFGDDYFSFYVDGVMFIVLNSQYYYQHANVTDFYEAQNVWFEQQLKKAKEEKFTHVVVFQHIPWFTEKIDEPNDYVS